LCQSLDLPGGGDRETSRIYRDKSVLKLNGHERPILRICADPGYRDALEDIQIGLPILPPAGSPTHFDLLRECLRTCDAKHRCHPEPDGPLPTRVIDVGDDKAPNLLRLYCPSNDKRGRYIALSHCWGKLEASVREKYCTYACNISQRLDGIDWDNLPSTFRDAVTVTRELGARFLWIDSMCIIQPHEGCSDECGEFKDWDIEAKKMETYYSSAYCTVAATSAGDSTVGFLCPRTPGRCLKITDAPGGPLNVCEAIGDFAATWRKDL
jgi:hypothetical protein